MGVCLKQVGGKHAALLEHIRHMQNHSCFGSDIDFKLARSSGALNALCTQETGFDSLQISLCKARPWFSPNALLLAMPLEGCPSQWPQTSILAFGQSKDVSHNGRHGHFHTIFYPSVWSKGKFFLTTVDDALRDLKNRPSEPSGGAQGQVPMVVFA